jgi:SpoVK/Ycf46/Vps4 family AAA+-type ATPase
MLSHTKTAPGFTIEALARKTDGLSGSDLKETCRNAAMVPVREFMREKGKAGKDGLEAARKEGFKVRPLTLEDFASTTLTRTTMSTHHAGPRPQRTLTLSIRLFVRLHGSVPSRARMHPISHGGAPAALQE